MYVKSVSLNNFRNYGGANLMFKNGLNVIVGKNASGKTNLLESVYFAGIGKSARATKDKELIRWGKDFCGAKIEVCKKYRTHIIEIRIDSKNKKYITIDDIPLTKIGDLLGYLNVVYFSPDEMKLVKESPVERRRFMDISLSQQGKIYFNSLVKYNRILSQRNKLLKQTSSINALKETLPIWDAQLAKEGARIIKSRYKFVEEIGKYAGEIHKTLTAEKEVLELRYDSLVDNTAGEDIEAKLLDMYAKSMQKDCDLGYTTVGAHRDDILIFSNGIEVKKFGSQGQQRTVALSLKLAEIERFEKETGEKPVLLLDDVLSELDASRQEQLLLATKNCQCLLTCAEFDRENKKTKEIVKQYVVVEDGKATIVAK